MANPSSAARRRLKIEGAVRAVSVRRPTALQQKQKRTSHQKLLDAAYSSFADLSYAATTIDHIVGRARVNRSTFYRHFDSKFAVAKALFDQFWPRLFAEFDRLGESSDPDEAHIQACIDHLLIFYRANKPFFLTLSQIPALEAEGQEWEETVRLEIMTRLGQTVPAFRKASSPAESTPDTRVRGRMTMMQFESAVYNLAFKEMAPEDWSALLRFAVRELRRFIVEGANAA